MRGLRAVRRSRALLLGVCLALLAVVAVAGAAASMALSASSGVSVESELADYQPGDLVVVRGYGWQPSESIHLLVNDDEGQTWSFNDDFSASNDDGSFREELHLPKFFVANYSVTATGALSGTATSSFTDSVAASAAEVNGQSSITVGAGDPVPGVVKATVNSSSTPWKSTGWTIGSSSGCADTANYLSASSTPWGPEYFNMKAPSSAGTYSAVMTPYTDDVTASNPGCSSSGTPTTLNNAVTVDSSVLFSEYFGSALAQDVPLWTDENQVAALDCSVSGPLGDDYFLAMSRGCTVSTTNLNSRPINTQGRQNIHVHFTWGKNISSGHGGQNLDLLWKLPTATTWTLACQTGQSSCSHTVSDIASGSASPIANAVDVSLPAAANDLAPNGQGTSINLRFAVSNTFCSGSSSGTCDDVRVDNVRVSGDPIPARGTTTQLASSLNPSIEGQQVTFTATVTATGGNPNAVGNVTFKDGTTPICSNVGLGGTNGNTASCQTSTLTAGSHNISATYSGTSSGSPTFVASTSNTVAQAVNEADHTPPTVSITVPNPSSGQGGYFNAADGVQTVTVSATDPSGVASLTCTDNSNSVSVGNQGSTATSRSGSFSLSGDGTHNIVCTATDNAAPPNSGAASGSTNTGTVKIDTHAPSVSCGSADGTWHDNDISIACTATDTGSGLADTASDSSFQLSTNVASGSETSNASTGSRNVADVAGNTATAGPIAGNKVDKQAPQQTGCDAADGNWHASNVTLNCHYSDGGSGPATQDVALATNVAGGAENANALASAGGTQACDDAGNCATSPTDIGGNKVDLKAPTSSVTIPTSGTYVHGTVALAASASDAGSGVGSVQFQYSSNGTTWTNIGSADASDPYGASWDASSLSDGDYSIRAVATDAVGNGNAAAASAITLKVDNTPPQITLTTPAETTYSYGQSVTAAYTCDDGHGSGTASCAGKDNGTAVANGGALPTTAVGQHTFTVTSADNLGNQSQTSHTYYVVAPTSFLSGGVSNYNGQQFVSQGTKFTVGDKLTSPASACVGSKPVGFALGENPMIGPAAPFTNWPGAYALGSANTDSSGQSSLTLTAATPWIEGPYDILVHYGGTQNQCLGSDDQGTLTITNPGDSANGGGWYTLPGSGRSNFGFVINPVPNTSPVQYKGQFLLINNNKWRMKGTLTTYSRSTTGTITLNGGTKATCSTTTPCGSASGSGNLYYWDTSNPVYPLGYWHQTSDTPNFSISFVAGAGGKNSTAVFGVIINHPVVSPPEPTTLPNSSPVPLKGGSITAK